jgi:hypothetical protein
MPNIYSSDSDQKDNKYDNFIERYLSGPSQHTGQGAAAEDEPMETGDDEETAAALPIWNTDDPEDQEGSPVSAKEYIEVPLTDPDYKDLISVKIKRTSFVRQEVSSHSCISFRPPTLVQFFSAYVPPVPQLWAKYLKTTVRNMSGCSDDFSFQAFRLDDHLFRIIFKPKMKLNHVLLLTAILGAIKEVIRWSLKVFYNYYIPRETPSPNKDYPTQVSSFSCRTNIVSPLTLTPDRCTSRSANAISTGV